MTVEAPRLGAADVMMAARRTAGRIRHTPLLVPDGLPGILLKAEHLQHGGSFKTRGAANAMLDLATAHVVTGSSGNHGIAVARLGAELGVEVTVVVAGGAAAGKAATIGRLGARVIEVPGGVAQRDRYAREHAARTGAAFVPSSDHRSVVAGAGTVGLEVFDAIPDLDVIFVPTGGGGLLAGVCLAAEGLRGAPRIVGVEPATARRYARSLAAGFPVELPPSRTVADGLRGQRPGEIPFPIIQRRVDELIEVTDEEILTAMELLRRDGVEAEPSGSVALAGALRTRFTGRAVAIVSGGNTPRRCRADVR
ncbi:threonine ammonia-lyase [Amycolatopsis decaplanina]|uniref:Pyridoxal-5'-phosphate-dependent protein subunit beta n=1 Tax=Amycolatopsis decaplanina DSM 44594 TaxID=1284240 RepID=M2YUW7_9PSEU|nr:pyridoxal-phosphate dependent enzyme [Amycolatopsis decaplanina]EME52493.1 pyridoxal-5'-phosphate-dependent protein subunit beta [Amycolatopsis decaplanina DSM 44594]